ncbi:MAG: hypothetical protein Kow0056_09400 [Coriobacteriia bacterium]
MTDDVDLVADLEGPVLKVHARDVDVVPVVGHHPNALLLHGLTSPLLSSYPKKGVGARTLGLAHRGLGREDSGRRLRRQRGLAHRPLGHPLRLDWYAWRAPKGRGVS